jgi:hypothetical protein
VMLVANKAERPRRQLVLDLLGCLVQALWSYQQLHSRPLQLQK